MEGVSFDLREKEEVKQSHNNTMGELGFLQISLAYICMGLDKIGLTFGLDWTYIHE